MKRVGRAPPPARGGLHAGNELAHFADDRIQLAYGLFEPLCIRLRDPPDALFGDFQPHSDGVERLQEVVVKVLAEAFPFFKRLTDFQFASAQRLFRAFLFRDVGADSDHTFGPVELYQFARNQKPPRGAIFRIERQVEIAERTCVSQLIHKPLPVRRGRPEPQCDRALPDDLFPLKPE